MTPNIYAVSAMLPLITPYSMPTDQTQAQTIYALAVAKAEQDGLNVADTVMTQALCYIIAHMMSAKDGSASVTSEHLGDWSASYATSSDGSSKWIAEYNSIKDDYIRGSLISDASSVEINDVKLSRVYPPDALRGID